MTKSIVRIFVRVVLVIGVSSTMAWTQTRDPETAKQVDQINPIKPAAKVTKTVLDNTVNKVLPFDIPTESKLTQDEKFCFDGCVAERDFIIKKNSSEIDRGHAWAIYNKCRSECPEKVANQNKSLQGDAFNQERYPAGSAIDH